MVIIMSKIAKIVGKRIRNYRTQYGYSQEKLAELSGCHPTYIGQLERGEKTLLWKALKRFLWLLMFHSQSYLKCLAEMKMTRLIILTNAMTLFLRNPQGNRNRYIES